MSIQRHLYLERMKKLVEMDPKKHVKKNPETGMFCVYDKSGKKVKEFKSEADANKYATDNHDALMKEDIEQVDEMMPHGMNLSVKSIENTPSMIAYRKKVKQDHEKRMKELQKSKAEKEKERLSKRETYEPGEKYDAKKHSIQTRTHPHTGKKVNVLVRKPGTGDSGKVVGTFKKESFELSEADKVMINELFLFITNDQQLYRQRITPLIKNYQKKMKKGIFDEEMAVKGFLYAVNDGIKKYNKEFGSGSMKLSKQEKEAVATKLLDYYQEELAGG